MTMNIQIALLLLVALIPSLAAPAPTLPGCTLAFGCLEEDGCLVGEYTAPQGQVVCQVTVFYQGKLQTKTEGQFTAPEPPDFYVEGLGTQHIYLEGLHNGPIPAAWFFIQPETSQYIFLPIVANSSP